jgi:hypothetical protein
MANPPDASFIIQVQVAIIGVIVVVGLFYIWRSVSRIEDNLQKIQMSGAGTNISPPSEPMHVPSCPITPPAMNTFPPENCEVAEFETDAIMKSVFGDMFMMSRCMHGGTGQGTRIEVTEMQDEDEEDEEEEEKEDEPHVHKEDDQESEAPSMTKSVNEMSKTKLKAMTINMLKELCSQRGLSTEGQKNTLIDRILSQNT